MVKTHSSFFWLLQIANWGLGTKVQAGDHSTGGESGNGTEAAERSIGGEHKGAFVLA